MGKIVSSLLELTERYVREGLPRKEARRLAKKVLDEGLPADKVGADIGTIKNNVQRKMTQEALPTRPVGEVPAIIDASPMGRKQLEKSGKLGAGAAGFGLVGLAGDTREIDGADTKKRIETTSPKEAEAADRKAKQAVEDPNKTIRDSVEDIFTGSDPSAASKAPMPGAYKAFNFNRTSTGKKLKSDLSEIGSEYEKALKEVENKKRVSENRIVMKKLLKDLVDAGALFYLMKHSPQVDYETGKHTDEYNRELQRLDSHIANTQSIVQSKFKELRDQTKESFQAEERAEDKRERGAERDFGSRQRYQERVDAAMRANWKEDQITQRAREKAEAAAISSREKSTAKKEDQLERERRSKLFQATNKNISALNKIIQDAESGAEVPVEEVVSKLKNMGATKDEIQTFTEEIEGIFWDSGAKSQDMARRFPPNYGKILAERQIEGLYGQQSSEPAPNERNEDRDLYNEAKEKLDDPTSTAEEKAKANAIIRYINKTYGE